MELGDLETRNLFGLLGIELEKPKEATFTEHDELSVGQDSGAAAIYVRCRRAVRDPAFVPVPHELAGVELDAAEMSVGLVAAAESVEIAIAKNGGGPVDF